MVVNIILIWDLQIKIIRIESEIFTTLLKGRVQFDAYNASFVQTVAALYMSPVSYLLTHVKASNRALT